MGHVGPVHLYEHIITRRYLNLDSEGNCYMRNRKGVEANDYVPANFDEEFLRATEGAGMTESLTVVVKGWNLEGLRQALAKGTTNSLRALENDIAALPAEGGPVIESITLAAESARAPRGTHDD